MIGEILAEGRELAEALMETRIRIRRRAGVTRDEDHGRQTPAWTDIYVGPARIRANNAQPQDRDAAGQRVTDQIVTVSLPIDAHPDVEVGASGDVQVDDVGEVLANPHDPTTVGLTFRIADTHDQTHSTARRFPAEVTTHA